MIPDHEDYLIKIYIIISHIMLSYSSIHALVNIYSIDSSISEDHCLNHPYPILYSSTAYIATNYHAGFVKFILFSVEVWLDEFIE